MYEYNTEFYQYINQGAAQAASIVIPALTGVIPTPITSVLDVGCGAGAWLSIWKSHGCQVTGLDGSYVDSAMLMIDADEFVSKDLAEPFELDQRFDLSQSLEVAEHLPAAAAAQFVASLCKSSDIVLFSAAPPGQGGENHINEQPYQYWQALFAAQGYEMYDAIRDAIRCDTRVMPWYRYNTFVYVNKAAVPEVHARLSEFHIAAGQTPKDKSPFLYQIRRQLIRAIPVKSRTRIAVLKKKLQIASRRVYGLSR